MLPCRPEHGPYRRGLDLDLQALDGGHPAAVQFVPDLPAQLDVDLLRLRRLHERRFRRRSQRRPGERAGPLADALGVRHTELEHPVVRMCVVEHLDPGEQRSDVAEEDAVAWSSYQSSPFTSIRASKGSPRRCFDAVQM